MSNALIDKQIQHYNGQDRAPSAHWKICQATPKMKSYLPALSSREFASEDHLRLDDDLLIGQLEPRVHLNPEKQQAQEQDDKNEAGGETVATIQ